VHGRFHEAAHFQQVQPKCVQAFFKMAHRALM
jgi:hypothetical protein